MNRQEWYFNHKIEKLEQENAALKERLELQDARVDEAINLYNEEMSKKHSLIMNLFSLLIEEYSYSPDDLNRYIKRVLNGEFKKKDRELILENVKEWER